MSSNIEDGRKRKVFDGSAEAIASFNVWCARLASKIKTKGQLYRMMLNGNGIFTGLSCDPTAAADVILVDIASPSKAVDVGMVTPAKGKQGDAKSPDDAKRAQALFNYYSEVIWEIILQNISDSVHRRLMNAHVKENDGIAAYKTLCKVHFAGGKANLMVQFQNLLSLTQTGNSKDYTYSFNRLLAYFASQKQQINPILALLLYMKGLDSRYESLKQRVLDESAKGIPALEEVQELVANRDDFSGVMNPIGANAGHSSFEKKINHKQSKKKHGKQKHNDDPRTTTREFNCMNCREKHRGGEHQCKAPCRLCGSKTHVRFHCPRKGQKNAQTTKSDSKDVGSSCGMDWGLLMATDAKLVSSPRHPHHLSCRDTKHSISCKKLHECNAVNDDTHIEVKTNSNGG
ncbi:MAG: hypothetical protein AAFR36_32570, partial [Bacteroidota bacterium]